MTYNCDKRKSLHYCKCWISCLYSNLKAGARDTVAYEERMHFQWRIQIFPTEERDLEHSEHTTSYISKQ